MRFRGRTGFWGRMSLRVGRAFGVEQVLKVERVFGVG